MKSLWNDQEAEKYQGDLSLRVYTSRLLGSEPSLVLHGGGNTSVKIREQNLVGETEDILYVKGSGWDLATIEAEGFSPVRINHLLKLAQLPKLSDAQMVNELKTQMTKANAPSPSVETILHATLPYKYVDHTHADAIVAITNMANGLERIQEIYGHKVVIIPYIMPGFDLARLCAQKFTLEAHEETLGMVLMNHGIFSFGATAQESYDRMIHLVSLAEAYLSKHQAYPPSKPTIKIEDKCLALSLAELRQQLSSQGGFPVIVSTHLEPKYLTFARREDVGIISQQGPATPDHIIRTKRLPLLGRDIDSYIADYQSYFNTYNSGQTMLDPLPRIILDQDFGMCTLGRNVKAAKIVADIYDHTIDVIEMATNLGGYQALSAQELFEIEYWELEQAKLRQSGENPLFTGEIALVTGGASGIGKACIESLLAQGAAVVGLDLNPDIEDVSDSPAYYGITGDVTDIQTVQNALEQTVRKFGGLDMLILNAGIFPGGCAIVNLDLAQWHQVMKVNLDANLGLMREAYPLLKLSPQGGRVVVIGSKNVLAPGPGAAAYSASKAALTQLTRVAALEWSKDKIRVNTVHPNAVFDTRIWTEEVLAERAKRYGLTVAEYKTNNLLGIEVTSKDVAQLVTSLCSPVFAKTTAAQIPIDGGNERIV